MKSLPASIIGLGIGLSMTLVDMLLLRWLDIAFTLQGEDAFGLALVLFGITYGLLGYIAGHLFDARKAISRDKVVIERQLQALQQSQQQVLHYEKLAMVGQLAAGVAHEVRNALGVINSSIALIVEQSQSLGPEGDKAQRFVHEEIARLDRFVVQLLDFSRPTVPLFDEVRLGEIYARIEGAWSLRTAAPTFELPDRRTTEDVSLSCDSDLLAQALLALLDNAAQAAGETGCVEMQAVPGDQVLTLAIRDSGQGVEPDARERLFEPFFTTKAQGTGLGLVTAQKILETHGGEIVYRDGRGIGPGGRGACFELSIPLRQPGPVASKETIL